MEVRLYEISGFLAEFAPLGISESWDNVGLLVGETSRNVHRVMTCLTLTADVAEEAISKDVDLIISHHPILFRPIQKLTSETSEGRLIVSLIQNSISVYSPHTAFDSARLGINQQLAESLELLEISPLRGVSDSDVGAGRWGKLAQPISLKGFIEKVRCVLRGSEQSLGEVPLQFTGDPSRMVQTVGVACGSAAEFLKDAANLGCEVFFTGEARFHTFLEARDRGIAMVLGGHYGTERPAVENLAKIIANQFPSVAVWASEVERDPVQWSVL
ncbi:Nif3-like dinuclear metal center hexameric protein [Planctomicrobium sp. SH668]|uniref:Nif3-like dinuclear metal center hexameric protein n=1 Tax=Planctomicrobium sp. SH668 TaxID=3448126 RepID=UPI003F5B78E3